MYTFRNFVKKYRLAVCRRQKSAMLHVTLENQANARKILEIYIAFY